MELFLATNIQIEKNKQNLGVENSWKEVISKTKEMVGHY
jgi:hypothetical protein